MIPKNFIIFILLIFLVFGGIFIWWPQYQDFKALQLQLKEKKIEFQNKEKYFSDLSQISQKLKKEYSSEIAKINLVLPAEPSVFDLLLLLEKISLENGLILKEFDIGTIVHLEAAAGAGAGPAPWLAPTPRSEPGLGPGPRPLAPAPAEILELRETPISISLLGSYSDFKNFLLALQKSARFFDLRSISFSSVKKEEEKEKEKEEAEEFFTFDLTIKVYSY